MFSRRFFVAATATLAAFGSGPAHAQSRAIEVVASFSILADLVRQVGGDRVQVRSIVPSGGDAHVYEPRPADLAALNRARLVVINGLGFEEWADRMVRAANYTGEKLVASRGVRALSVKGQVDPHAWQDAANVKIYIDNIRDALSKVDPAGAGVYASRAAAYQAQLDRLDAEIRGVLGRIPATNRKVVTSHDAFHYFGDAYDVVFIAPQGISTDSAPSAQAVATIIRQIKDEGVRALFMENMSSGRIVQQIARETGVKVGGTLYADALGGGAASYLAMMRHNARTIASALAR